jgi:hypothetical protein
MFISCFSCGKQITQTDTDPKAVQIRLDPFTCSFPHTLGYFGATYLVCIECIAKMFEPDTPERVMQNYEQKNV